MSQENLLGPRVAAIEDALTIQARSIDHGLADVERLLRQSCSKLLSLLHTDLRQVQCELISAKQSNAVIRRMLKGQQP